MKKLIFLAIAILAGVQIRAQVAPAAAYTVEQCVEMALQNSKDAAIARNDVASAISLRKEAFTKYFPEIGATGLAFWANHHVLQYNVLDLIELGIIKKGRSGGIQALQPIFTGGQIVNGNKLASVGEEVARLRETQTLDDLRLNTETIFWKLASLEATKQTLHGAVTTLDSIENQVQAAVDAGIVTRNDLLKVQLKRNTYRSQMVDLDNGIALVKMLLGQYMGLGTEGNIEIVSDVPTQLPPFPFDIYVMPDDAVCGTVDYKLLDKNIEAKKLEKRMELGKYLPTVAVGAGWYYHNLLEQNHNFGAVQLGITVPISQWWGGSHALKRKSLELLNAENRKDDLTQKLIIRIQEKWNNLTAAHRKMEIETEGIAQSQENYRLNTMYYEAGMSTIGDLLEAETALKEAHEKFIAAYGEFRTAQSQYLIATGR